MFPGSGFDLVIGPSLTGVIPNIGTDDAEEACRPLHFAYCFWLVGNEIYYKALLFLPLGLVQS